MEIGSVVNSQYTVIEHVGRGGMADVWSARDQRLRRMVAIKTIARNLSPDIDPVALFEREARTIAQMEHPHILPIYDFGEFEGSLYIVMRYMTGGSLEDVLSRGPMDTTDVLQMGHAVAQAMDYAHKNNVIHLDLKPPNILLDSQQMPYLADFGLATALDPEGHARNPGSGTLLYMAPEQLTSELIDRRADIYSFSIMLFHMLTGQLPFDGTAPLAVRQIQYHDELPNIEEFVPDIPSQVTDILRSGTMQDPSRRPPNLSNIVEQMRDVLVGSSAVILPEGIPDAENLFKLELPAYDTADSELLEAIDIYSRARHAWAGGQGRFLVSMTHYLLMVQYYMDADFHDLIIDKSGYEMLLRGAIEYDYEIEYWWNKLDDASRRLVCLHTIRSGTTPARIRGFSHLETLSDDEANPTIPRLVSQALGLERDPHARIAALQLLGTRAQLVKTTQTFEIMTQFRGRMLTTMTRMGLLLAPASVWRDTVYSIEIDQLIAEQALDTDEEAVSEFAARTVGRMRSLAAVQYLAGEQRTGRQGALRALGFVRDEAPSLPEGISPQARFYAWATNTVRRLSARPLDLIARFLLVLVAAWIGMGQQVYNTWTSMELFSLQRMTNTLGFGMMFGLLAALVVFFSDELSRRLRGFWPWWARLLVFGAAGYFMAVVAWYLYQLLFLQYDPPITLAALAGLGLSFGYIISALISLSPWQSVLLATITSWIPLYAGYASYYENNWFHIGWSVPFAVIVGLVVGVWMHQYTYQYHPQKSKALALPWVGGLAVGGVVAAIVTWGVYGWLHTMIFDAMSQAAAAQGIAIESVTLDSGPFTWTGLGFLVVVPLVLCIFIGFFWPGRGAWAFGGLFLLAFTGLYLQFGPSVLSNPPLSPDSPDTILYFDLSGFFGDQTGMIYTISLPMMFITALGANFPALMRSWWRLVGAPQHFHERSAWLGGVLGYTIAASIVVSIFALFSIKAHPAWAIAWCLWGVFSFVSALAAWRWARWGARATVVLSMLALIGGFLYDAQLTAGALNTRMEPPLFEWSSRIIWLVWALWLAFFTVSLWRRKLWGVIGVAIMMILWWVVAFFAPIQESYALLGAMHLALMAYAMGTEWGTFEADRFHLPEVREPHVPSMAKSELPPTAVLLERPSVDQENRATTKLRPATEPIQPFNEEELEGIQRRSPHTRALSPHKAIITYEESEIGKLPTELDIDYEAEPPPTVQIDMPEAPEPPQKPPQTHSRVGNQMITEYDPSSPHEPIVTEPDGENDEPAASSMPPQAPETPVPDMPLPESAAPGNAGPGATKPLGLRDQTDRHAFKDETTPSFENDTEPETNFPAISFDIGSLEEIGMQTRPPLPDFLKREEDAPMLDMDLSDLDTRTPASPDRPTELDAGYIPDEDEPDDD